MFINTASLLFYRAIYGYRLVKNRSLNKFFDVWASSDVVLRNNLESRETMNKLSIDYIWRHERTKYD